ncbi:hypothetical protein [Bacillus mycoides]
MAFVALDGENTVYANEIARLPNKDKIYLCKNLDCSAEMKIAAIGSESRRPYLTTNGTKKPHIPGCLYGNTKNGINTRYDESNFNLNRFIDHLFMKKNVKLSNTKRTSSSINNKDSSTDKPIKTLSQLYYFVKQHNPDYRLDGVPLYQVLSDRRTRSVNFFSGHNKFYGNIMAEVTFCRYDTKKNLIVVNPQFNPDLKFNLNFKDEETFKLIRDKIYLDKQNPFVVFADWKGKICEIHSLKQVVFPTIIE